MSAPKVIRFNLPDAKWTETVEFGGGESILYTSPDRTRMVVAFRESGKHTFKYTFDEFAYVTRGSARVSVRGGETFTIKTGESLYVEEGAVIDFEMSDDFEDITVLVSNKPFAWR
jgi:uncharacterized cupin superfamily protein